MTFYPWVVDLASLSRDISHSWHLGYPPHTPALGGADTAETYLLRGFSSGLILGLLCVSDTGPGLEQGFATAYCVSQFQSSRYLDCQSSHIISESI